MKKLINKLMCNSQNSVNIQQNEYTNLITETSNIPLIETETSTESITENKTKTIENLNNIIKKLTNKIDKLEKKIQEYKLKYEELQHIERLSSHYICNICLVNPKNVLFMPCGHFVSCLDCMNSSCDAISNSLTDIEQTSTEYIESRYKCPMCRITVEYYKDIYT
jgi:rubrerythrin